MHKILVIDDDKKRNEKIVNLLKGSFQDIEIHSAFSTNEAKGLLTNNFYFSIFLDMALPLRNTDKKVDENAGLKLLESISRGRFKKIPNRVIGFTALPDNFADKEEQFDTLGFKLFESRAGDFSWIDRAISQVNYTLNSLNSYNELPTDLAVLSVHGIETDGRWQENLHKLIGEEYKDVDISDLLFKFEKFPLIRFIIPNLRTKMVDKFSKEFSEWLEKNKAKRIVCFAHSFGTYILIKALEKLEAKEQFTNIDLILLSGSVLKQNYDFTSVKKIPNIRIVNECAKQDGALLFSKGAVWGTGMGGRLGFSGLMNKNFVNRSYDGGHSVFFENNNSIVKQHWIPLLDLKNEIVAFNKAANERRRDKCYEYTARMSSKIKLMYYMLFYSLPLVFIFLTILFLLR